MKRLLCLFLLSCFSLGSAMAAEIVLAPGLVQNLLLTRSEPKATVSFWYPASQAVGLRLKTTAKGREVSLSGMRQEKYGILRVTAKFQEKFDSGILAEETFSSLPPLPGTWTIELNLRVSKEDTPLTVSLEPIGPLPAVTWADTPGTLIIRRAGSVSFKIVPEAGFTTNLSGFKSESLRPDLTPAGDSMFRLPAGFWRVQATPMDRGVRLSQAVLIPVSAGGITEIDWPVQRPADEGLAAGLTGLRLREATATTEIGKVRVAAPSLAQVPTIQQTQVLEGGQPGEILAIEPATGSLHVVLLLDSSGSMKKQLKGAIQAAVQFVEGLPPSCSVEIIDFDSTPKPVKATSRSDLTKALLKIKPDGATALNDTVLAGLERARQRERSTVVLFTDGFDANHNDTGPGSKATPEKMFSAVSQAGLPLFTIGFGDKPDEATLSRLAAMSGGAFFRAQPDTISQVFAQINDLISREFVLSYRRPAEIAAGNTPVISVLIDVSGSMMHNLICVRQLFREWIDRLPRMIVQLTAFSSLVDIVQVATDDRMRIGHAISSLSSGGGTEVVKAVDTALRGLQGIPSRRRFLLFVTDAAINVDPANQVKFEALLGAVKDAGIRSLWVGMVEGESPKTLESFARVSKLAGGEYLITPGVSALQNALSRIEQVLATTATGPTEIPVQILVHVPGPDQSKAVIEGNSLFPFPAPANQTHLSVGCLQVSCQPGSVTAPSTALQATAPTSQKPGAADRLSHQETNRLPMHVSGETSAVRLTVNEATIYSRVQGIETGNTRRFVSLNLTLENRLPVQEVTMLDSGETHPSAWVQGKARGRTIRAIPPYLIPDLRRHLFLRWNDGSETPVSPATVFLPTPLFHPDDPRLLIASGAACTGQVTFVVDTPNLQKASLHLYDTSWGHLDLPLVGSLTARPQPLSELPTRASGNLSETFRLNVQQFTDLQNAVAGFPPPAGLVFRIVQVALDSQVQAHMKFDPVARLRLVIDTLSGPLVLSLSALTERIPGGWYASTLLMPGSRNLLKLAFPLPIGLASAPAALYIELKGPDLLLPLSEGTPLPALFAAPSGLPPISVPVASPEPASGSASTTGAFLASASGVPPNAVSDEESSGVEVVINRAMKIGQRQGFTQDHLLLDLTITDLPDGAGSRLSRAFSLIREDQLERNQNGQWQKRVTKSRKLKVSDNKAGHKGMGSLAKSEASGLKTEIFPLAGTGDYLFGFTDGTAIFDGTRRRGLLLMEIPPEGNWYFSILDDVLPTPVHLQESEIPEEWLLTKRVLLPTEQMTSLESVVAAAVKNMKLRGELRRIPSPNATAPIRIDENGTSERPEAPCLALTWPGAQNWSRLLAGTEADLRAALATLRLIPAPLYTAVQLSPEALFTQRSGTMSDLQNAVFIWYQSKNQPVQLFSASLTDAGKAEWAKTAPVAASVTPALALEGALVLKTTTTSWVFPFCQTTEQSAALIDATSLKPWQPNPGECDLQINVVCVPANRDQAAAMGDMGSALGGGSKKASKTFTLFKGRLSSLDLSKDATDLYYLESGPGRDRQVTAVLDGPFGRQIGTTGFNPKEWHPIREEIVYSPRGLPKVDPYVRNLDNESLTEGFHCLALGIPDLSASAARELAEAWVAKKPAALPDPVSIAKWAARARLASFLSAQTAWETRTAAKLDVLLSRVQRPRMLVYTGTRRENAWQERIDLRQHAPDTMGDPSAVQAFALMHGPVSTSLEGACLGGRSVTDIWKSTGDFLVVPPKSHGKFLRDLQQKKFPEGLIKQLRATSGVLLFARHPTKVQGKPMWGWLEIDPKTFVTISTLSTGDRGGMVEEAIADSMVDANSFALGFMVGIDASIWSVAAFSLEESKYEVILSKGETFAQSLASCFNNISEDPSFAPEDGPVSFSLGGVDYNDGEDSSYRSFTDGYNAGVKYYFERARK